MATTAQKEALASNTTFNCELVKITAKDSTVAAFAFTSRSITYLSTTYYPTSGEISRSVQKIGLEPDAWDFTFANDVLTRDDIEANKWRGATVERMTLVNYFDLSLGHVNKQKGKIGKIVPVGEMFKAEVNSISHALSQTVGDLIGPIDRRRRLDDVLDDISAYTHAAEVLTVTDRRTFTVDVTEANSYFKYGLAIWQTGDNADLEMEIKDNDGDEITLQLGTPSEIQVGDTLDLIMGYDGSRAAATALGAEAIESVQAEPDVPPTSFILRYPE